jgi:hypothetical protein
MGTASWIWLIFTKKLTTGVNGFAKKEQKITAR